MFAVYVNIFSLLTLNINLKNLSPDTLLKLNHLLNFMSIKSTVSATVNSNNTRAYSKCILILYIK